MLLLVPGAVGLGTLIARSAVSPARASDLGEASYLRFLAFYALVFPLYVWLFMCPRMSLTRTRAAITGYLLTVLVSAPLFEAGFIHHHTWLLMIPTAALLVWTVARASNTSASK